MLWALAKMPLVGHGLHRMSLWWVLQQPAMRAVCWKAALSLVVKLLLFQEGHVQKTSWSLVMRAQRRVHSIKAWWLLGMVPFLGVGLQTLLALVAMWHVMVSCVMAWSWGQGQEWEPWQPILCWSVHRLDKVCALGVVS
jgi:hypothetical protein